MAEARRSASDQFAFELTDRSKHVKQQASRRCGCINLLVEHDEVDLSFLDLVHQIREIRDGTRQPVETCHQKLVSFAHKL